MPIRSVPPVLPAKAAAEKAAKKADEKYTKDIYWAIIALLALLHLVLAATLSGRGLAGYLESWRAIGVFAMAHPTAAFIIPACLFAIYKAVFLWRAPDPVQVRLPAYPPVPDLRWTDKLHIGSGWTRRGLQPGELWDRSVEDDGEFFAENPHVILQEKGLFGNLHVLGGVGGGKTATFIMPAIQQAISKYPKPPSVDAFPVGASGRIAGGPQPRPGRKTPPPPRPTVGEDMPGPAPTPGEWNPYAGMTLAEAQAEHDRLLALHQERRWGLFIIDPKGDMTEFVQRVAALHGRAEDVIVLRPDGQYTYNALAINASALVQAEMVLEGIEAVTGQQIHAYYKQTMAEWLANGLTILRTVDPTRTTFKSVLRMARNEQLRSAMVAEADAIMRQAQEEEERLKRLGQTYTGVRVNGAAIEFFREWDDVDSDPQRKQAIVSTIKAQAKYFVDDAFAPFLSPEMPVTFEGFEAMIDKGQIVVLQCPLDKYGPVAKVLGVLMLGDAQQAARTRINKPEMNQDRVVLFAVDEVSNYLNSMTKDFVSMNRQSRVCFLAAHQSLGQLAERGKAYEQSFSDNMRTKISYNAPNAEAGRRLTAMMGGRTVFRERWSENRGFQGISALPNTEHIKTGGTATAGASVSIEEIDRPWFSADDFVALNMGELIIMEFDGNTTLPPRKIKAPVFFASPEAVLAAKLSIESPTIKPHPVVSVSDDPASRDYEYIAAALGQTGYVIVEPLASAVGELEGFKFVTDVGTLVMSCDMLDRVSDSIVERLSDPQILVVFTDLVNCTLYFGGQMHVPFERVLDFATAFRTSHPGSAPASFHAAFQAATGRALGYHTVGSWEYHRNVATNRAAILRDSRAIMDLYSDRGRSLLTLGDDALEALYDATRERMEAIKATGVDPTAATLTSESPNATSTPAESLADDQADLPPEAHTAQAEVAAPVVSREADEPSGPEVNAQQPALPVEQHPAYVADDAPFQLPADDPFSASAYPEHLLGSSAAATPNTDAAPSLTEPIPIAPAPVRPRLEDLAPPKRMRRSKKKAAPGTGNLFEPLPQSPLADPSLADDEAGDADAAPGVEGLVPLDGLAHLPDVFTTDADSASRLDIAATAPQPPGDATAAVPRRTPRRGDTGAARRGARQDASESAPTEGVASDGAPDSSTGPTGPAADDDRQDLVEGAPE